MTKRTVGGWTVCRHLAVTAAIACGLAACDSAGRDWKEVSAKNDTASYAAFVQKHPQDARVKEANAAIDRLAWEAASAKGTREALSEYIERNKGGAYRNQAEAGIDDIDWRTAIAATSLAGYQTYAQDHPSGSHLADAQAQIKALTPAVLTGVLQISGAVAPAGELNADITTEAGHQVSTIAYSSGHVMSSCNCPCVEHVALLERRGMVFVISGSLTDSAPRVVRLRIRPATGVTTSETGTCTLESGQRYIATGREADGTLRLLSLLPAK